MSRHFDAVFRRTAYLSTDVDRYLTDCFARQTAPRVSELAERLGMSRERLSRAFVSMHGVALSTYLKERQIVQACQLLTSSDMTTAQIAYLSGFGTRRTLYRTFRRRIGLSPDEFRRTRR